MPLAADIRECPVTWGLAATWTLVFVAMLAAQHALGVPAPEQGMGDPLGVSPVIGHRFGDLTWAEVRRGEAWRLVTATFVHFGLIHIAMNVTALIKLGQLIEPWYGGGPFLAACLMIGGLGNFVGGLLRLGVTAVRTLLAGTFPARVLPGWFDTGGPAGIEAAWHTPSGGGSTILLGLLGLGAVVGWRSKTRIGSFLRDQMVVALALTAVLGFVLVNLLDNYGHAGGAIVGAAIGFVHRPLLRLAERSRAFRAACWVLASAVLLASLGAAIRDDRAEVATRAHAEEVRSRFQLDDATLGDLDRLAVQYARLVARGIDAEARDGRGETDPIALELLLDPRLVLRPSTAGGRPGAASLPPDRIYLDPAGVLAGLDEIPLLGRAAEAVPRGQRVGLDLIALEPLLNQLVVAAAPGASLLNAPSPQPGRLRLDLAGTLDALAARPSGSWGPDGAEALAAAREAARRALDRDPRYADAYDFALAWRRAWEVVRVDLERAKAEQVRLAREFN